ncbi:hypothetical protein ABTZ46_11265 [Nocardioides sp. NPDC126508]
MLLSTSSPRRLGGPRDRARLRIGPADESVPYSERSLVLSGKPAFGLTNWCGTCAFLFERKADANASLSSVVERLSTLERAVDAVDEGILETFSPLLSEGDYLPMLLEFVPELVAPYDARDYFTHEQVATWGLDSFWGLPENPRSYYYRTFETAVADDEHLYEFVVPMVPPTWNDRERVQHYLDLFAGGETPTAVALSTLDVCQPAMADEATDYYVHWGLTHFLMDGHHKMEAAARSGAKVRLLALVSLEGSLATDEDLRALPELLGRPPRTRGV